MPYGNTSHKSSHNHSVFIDKKTEISVLLLPHILLPPPKRGVKRPRIGRNVATRLLFVDFDKVGFTVYC